MDICTAVEDREYEGIYQPYGRETYQHPSANIEYATDEYATVEEEDGEFDEVVGYDPELDKREDDLLKALHQRMCARLHLIR